jgi:hypothetical protein
VTKRHKLASITSCRCIAAHFLQLMAAGVPVAFLAGAGLCWGHLVYAWKTALKFKVLPEGVKFRNIHRSASFHALCLVHACMSV